MTGRKIFKATTAVLDTLFAPAVTATVAYLCKNGVEDASSLSDSSIKTTIQRDFTLTSSVTNAVAIGYTNLSFLSTILQNDSWRFLSASQRGSLLFCLGAAFGLGAMSLSHFNETNSDPYTGMYAAGNFAAGSALLFNTGKNLASFFTSRALLEEEARRLNEPLAPAQEEAKTPRMENI